VASGMDPQDLYQIAATDLRHCYSTQKYR